MPLITSNNHQNSGEENELLSSTAGLSITIHSLDSLKKTRYTELTDCEVILSIQWGKTVIETEPLLIQAFCPVFPSVTFSLPIPGDDCPLVAELLSAKSRRLYGHVEFTCIGIQLGVPYQGRYAFIGNYGTPNSFISGSLTLTLYSNSVGRDYPIDYEEEYATISRLRRFFLVYLPERLHLINIIAAATYDINVFFSDLVQKYGPEPPMYTLYLTVVDAQNLIKSNEVLDSLIVIRLGSFTFETRVAKNTSSPMFHESFMLEVDNLAEDVLCVLLNASEGFTELCRASFPLREVNCDQLVELKLPVDYYDKKNPSHAGGIFRVTYITKNIRLKGNDVNKIPFIPPMFSRRSTKHSHRTSQGKGENFSHESCNRKIDNPVIPQNKDCTFTDSFRKTLRVSPNSNNLNSVRGTELMQRKLCNSASINSQSQQRCGRVSCEKSDHMTVSNAVKPTHLLVHGSTTRERISQKCDTNKKASVIYPTTCDASLIVCISACLDLENAKKHVCIPKHPGLPNSFVAITLGDVRIVTKTVFGSSNPVFGQRFELSLDNVTEALDTELAIAVFSTPSVDAAPDEVVEIGRCVFSLKNVLQGVPKRWNIPLVVNPETRFAVQAGELIFSILLNGIGFTCIPSSDTEERFLQRLTHIFQLCAPQKLHRVPWMLGEYAGHENNYLSYLAGSMLPHNELSINVIVCLLEAHSLVIGKRKLENPQCFIKLEVSKEKFKSSVSKGHRSVPFDEWTTFSLLRTEEVLHVKVYENNFFPLLIGEVDIALYNLSNGLSRTMTHMLVANAKTQHATPCGFLRLVLRSDLSNNNSETYDSNEMERYRRIRRYFLRYIPEELHQIDVILRKQVNLDAYMKSLTAKLGPEPRPYSLTLIVERCGDLFIPKALGTASPFVVVRIGLEEYSTKSVTSKQDAFFNEKFIFDVADPSTDELLITVWNEGSVHDTESGRVVLSLHRLICDQEISIRAPLTYLAGTNHAQHQGFVDIRLTAHYFGLPKGSPIPSSLERMKYSQKVGNLLLCYDRAILHRGELLLEKADNKEEIFHALQRRFSSQKSTPIIFRLYNIETHISERPILLHIAINATDVLRVTIQSQDATSDLERIREKLLQVISNISNPINAVVSLKFSSKNMGRSRPLGSMDIPLRIMCLSSDQENHLEIPLFSQQGEMVAEVKFSLYCSQFFQHNANCMSYDEKFQAVIKDCISLFQKFSPQRLKDLYAIIGEHQLPIHEIHSYHRKFFNPHVRLTLYCTVHCAQILKFQSSKFSAVETREIWLIISHDTEELAVRAQQDSDGSLTFPLQRLDIQHHRTPLYLKLAVGSSAQHCDSEIGSVHLSLAALLTPCLYGINGIFTFPLFSPISSSGACEIVSNVSLSLSKAVFDEIPASLQLSLPFSELSKDVHYELFDYFHILEKQFMSSNPSLLRDWHINFFEKYLTHENWKTFLPEIINHMN